MRFLIRTDASARIGSGHVMRCLTLAIALRHRGDEVEFACRPLTSHLIDLIEAQGFVVHRLDVVDETEDGGIQDAAATVALLATRQDLIDWVIVDHYGLDARWERQLRAHARRIMVIDDLADRPHDCDLLLDQHCYRAAEGRYRGLVPPHCRLLIGPHYAILREDFSTQRSQLAREFASVKRILVAFGGVDAGNMTARTLRAISHTTISGIHVDVVIGSQNPYRDEIEAMVAGVPGATLVVDASDMAQRMAAADLAIGAGGTMTWERCSMGLPSAVVSIAGNQEETSRALAEAGAIVYLGGQFEVSDVSLREHLHVLIANPWLRRVIGQAAGGLADGRGTWRVLREIRSRPVRLREAQARDSDDLLRWRNAEINRRYALNAEPISLETHRGWFSAVLENPAHVILIGEVDERPVGVIRFEIADQCATVSIYLVPECHGLGIGAELLQAGEQWLRANRASVKSVQATILDVNQASRRLFGAAGYKPLSSVYSKVLV